MNCSVTFTLVCIQVHYNIAKIHADLGNVDYAISEYKLAIRFVVCLFIVAYAVSVHSGTGQF